MSEDNNNNNQTLIEKVKELYKTASLNKKLVALAMIISLLAGIVFLILGNSSNFFYSSICFVAFYILLKGVK